MRNALVALDARCVAVSPATVAAVYRAPPAPPSHAPALALTCPCSSARCHCQPHRPALLRCAGASLRASLSPRDMLLPQHIATIVEPARGQTPAAPPAPCCTVRPSLTDRRRSQCTAAAARPRRR